jgi:AcrR family transcriptional regulator
MAALAGGATVADASERAGVAERTVYRRLKDEAFLRQVAETRSGMVKAAVGQLVQASTDAVATLRGLLKAQSETVQLGAARSILELGAKLRESSELEERLAALEAAVPQPSRTNRR